MHRRQQWWHELTTDGALVRRSRPGRMLLALLGSIAFTAFGAAVWIGGVVWFGAFVVLFFGVLGIPALVWRLVTGRPVLRVDADGVQVDDVRVPWTAVTGTSVLTTTYRGVPTARVVVLELDRAGDDALMGTRPGWARGVKRANEVLLHRGRRSFEVPTGYGLRAQDLAAWLDDVRRWARVRPSPG